MATRKNQLITIADDLTRELSQLSFGPPVAHVYAPLTYARAPYCEYIERYGAPPRQTLLVGMNPGPFGMTQTGVPFGEVTAARDFLGIRADTERPARQHERRPILGFDCHRSEVSGARLWGWAEATYKTPERFFEQFFVANYCPLVFLEPSGRNLTPDKLSRAEREPLYACCDRALRRVVEYLEPRFVVGVGAFATERARVALMGMELVIGRVPHPSPASPAANRGWAKAMAKALKALGVPPPSPKARARRPKQTAGS